MRPSREALALGASALTAVQVGLATVASRAALPAFGPGPLAVGRYLIAAACLLPVYLALRPARFRPADLAAVAGLGALQFGVLIALFNYGLMTVPATRAATLFATFPLMTLGLSALLGRERLTAAKLGGLALTVVGVAATLGDDLSAPQEGWTGSLLVLAAAATGAACSVAYRPYLARYPTLDVGFVAMAASVVVLAAGVTLAGSWPDPARIGRSDWALLALIGASSGIGYALLLWALKTIAPSRVTAFLALAPVTAAALGVAFLGEAVGLGSLAGVACVAGGLRLATGRGRDSSASRRSGGRFSVRTHDKI